MDFEFRPRLGPTVIAAAIVVVLLALGTWQIFRFIEKSAQEDKWAERIAGEPTTLENLIGFEAGAADHRRVIAFGEIDGDRVALYANQRFRGEPGCLLASPLRLRGGGTILTVRGFVPHTRTQRCDKLEITPPSGDSFLGLIYTLRPNLADMPNRSQSGKVTRWETFDVEGTYPAMGIEDGPSSNTVLVLDEKHVGDPFPLASFEHVSAPYLTSMRHLNYAGTWYITVLLVIGLWGAISMKRVEALPPFDDSE